MGKRLTGICLAVSFALGCAAAQGPAPLPGADATSSVPADSPSARAKAAASRGELFIPSAFEKEIVTIECDDGYHLSGDYLRRRQSRAKMPGVIFIHGYGEDRRSFYPLSLHLAGRGYAVLAIDLRGHGENPDQIGNPKKKHDELTMEDFLMMSKDIRNCVGHLAVKREIDGGRICLIGSGLGANLALIAAAQSWADAIRCVVAVSPGLEYQGIGVGSAPGQISANKAIYLAAAKQDDSSFESASRIYSELKTLKEFYVGEGSEHGMQLLRMGLFPKIPKWIMEHMPPVIPEQAPGANRR